MNRRHVLLAIGTGIAAPSLLLKNRAAEAVTPQTQMQPLIREDYYPNFERKYPNIPGTNFRAARPEEYPYHFSDDCSFWRRGGALFDCRDFYPRRLRRRKNR